jgi:hypothetical protein
LPGPWNRALAEAAEAEEGVIEAAVSEAAEAAETAGRSKKQKHPDWDVFVCGLKE